MTQNVNFAMMTSAVSPLPEMPRNVQGHSLCTCKQRSHVYTSWGVRTLRSSFSNVLYIHRRSWLNIVVSYRFDWDLICYFSPPHSDRHTPVQRSIERLPLSDYVPQPVEAVIQRSTPTNPTFATPSQNPNQQRASHYDHPRRFASPISEEETGGVTEVDIAPSRPKTGKQKSRSNRNTLERNEYSGGDMLAPLTEGNGPSKGPREPTSRFRKWQMKTQPYILLSTGIRLRLSIAAGDLLGKSHEELVLLLIQLRRDQSNLERWLDMIDQELALLIDPTTPPGGPSKIRAKQ